MALAVVACCAQLTNAFTQRLEEVGEWEAVQASAAALPGLWELGQHAPAALISGAGLLSALADASGQQLLEWCGGNTGLAGDIEACLSVKTC